MIKSRFVLVDFLNRKHRGFLFLTLVLFAIAGVVYQNATLAMWFAFSIASFAAISNDSVQSLGTFIAVTKEVRWYVLWAFISVIFILAIGTGWFINDGDVSFHRLSIDGFQRRDQQFHFLQLAAPVFLLVLSRFRMPVSTTFLLLSPFSTDAHTVIEMLNKSIVGYFVAFIFAFTLRSTLDRFFRSFLKREPSLMWVSVQWVSTACLWVLWLIQDTANFAVYLPESLNGTELLIFMLIIVIGIGILIYLRGDKIQDLVNEKNEISDVRSATIIDIAYIVILFIFTFINTIPMSTTWVFLGILGGRELGLKVSRKSKIQNTWQLIIKDILYALAGLVFSIFIAFAINPGLKQSFVRMIMKH